MNYRFMVTTIQVHEKVKQELDTLKKSKRESYEDIILRLINSAEKQKRTQVELLIDGYKEMTKENLDIEKEWSKTDIDWD